MKDWTTRKGIRFAVAMLAVALAIAFLLTAGRILVVDSPQPSDVILVLAGESYHRPQCALDLLKRGYARRVIINVPADTKIYNFTLVELTEKYVHDLPDSAAVTVCPTHGLSTRDESLDAAKCLDSESGSRILIVTSDFHTRRALSIFRHEVPGKSFSVAAARDSTQFGTRWWAHRQWAKTCIDEWLRMLWWNGIERWQ